MAEQEKLVVLPPPYEEIQLVTHCLCCSCGFWTKLPECVGLRSTGTCCCCTGAAQCSLKPDMDVCNSGEGKSYCLSLKACREQGFTQAPLCEGASKGILCFLCMTKNQYTCAFPHTCCKCANQECCIDYRVALPPDQDVPFGCAVCGFWIKKPDQMPTGWNGVSSGGAGGGGGAPASEVMPQG